MLSIPVTGWTNPTAELKTEIVPPDCEITEPGDIIDAGVRAGTDAPLES